MRDPNLNAIMMTNSIKVLIGTEHDENPSVCYARIG